MTTSKPVEVLSRPSRSRLAEVYARPEFQVAWSNEVPLQIARHAVRLRRLRRMSQATVGGLMGTSQSAVARIESAQENITLSTLRRLITALRGRFQVSITPEEVQLPQWPVWWEMMDAGLSATTPYVLKGVALQDDGHTRRVGAGWESQEETSSGPLLIEAKAS